MNKIYWKIATIYLIGAIFEQVNTIQSGIRYNLFMKKVKNVKYEDNNDGLMYSFYMKDGSIIRRRHEVYMSDFEFFNQILPVLSRRVAFSCSSIFFSQSQINSLLEVFRIKNSYQYRTRLRKESCYEEDLGFVWIEYYLCCFANSIDGDVHVAYRPCS